MTGGPTLVCMFEDLAGQTGCLGVWVDISQLDWDHPLVVLRPCVFMTLSQSFLLQLVSLTARN